MLQCFATTKQASGPRTLFYCYCVISKYNKINIWLGSLENSSTILERTASSFSTAAFEIFNDMNFNVKELTGSDLFKSRQIKPK